VVQFLCFVRLNDIHPLIKPSFGGCAIDPGINLSARETASINTAEYGWNAIDVAVCMAQSKTSGCY